MNPRFGFGRGGGFFVLRNNGPSGMAAKFRKRTGKVWGGVQEGNFTCDTKPLAKGREMACIAIDNTDQNRRINQFSK